MNNNTELLACPCCHYLTLSARGQYEICKVCFWEDDGSQQASDYSMPNKMFLGQGQENFITLGACDEIGVRAVNPEDKLNYKKSESLKKSDVNHLNTKM